MDKFSKFWIANSHSTNGMIDGGVIKYVNDTFGKWGQFCIDNADVILLVSTLEKISPELLAVTWMNETSFRFYSEPNTNGHFDNFTYHDVGPLQLNVGWLERNISVKYLNPVGLDVPKITGTMSNIFNGDPIQNLRMGARMLLRIGKTDDERVVKYTGPAARAYRLKSWQQFGPMFKTFFDEYKK